MREPAWPRWVWALVALTFAYGLWRAVALSWLCDDAFISFRYAQNLVRGHGLVFNVGEQVEGYTNFLWTVVIAGAMRLGIAPETFSVVAGLIAWVTTISVLLWGSRRDGAALPVAALGLLLCRDAQIWATSGLETSLFTLFAIAGHRALTEARTWRGSLCASSLLVAATLTRPDGLLFWLAAGAAWVLLERPGRRRLYAWCAPVVGVYLPYWVLRFQYYGWPFPNTYYAKSAGLPHWRQGARFLLLHVEAYPLLAATLAVGLVVLALRPRFALARQPPGRRAPHLLAAVMALPWLLYVVRVGGDFMFARLLVPALPLLLLVAEGGLRIFVREPRWRSAAGVLVVLGCVLHLDPFDRPRQVVDGITDEASWYPEEALDVARRRGTAMQPFFATWEDPVAFGGGQAMVVYYAEPSIAIEVMTGLTDEAVAHQPIRRRGRPGHEKQASLHYLLERRASLLLVSNPVSDPLQRVQVGDGEMKLSWYDCRQAEQMRQAGANVPDLSAAVDRLLAGPPPGEPQTLYSFLYGFYFLRNDDGPRELAFRSWVALPTERLPRLPWMGASSCPPRRSGPFATSG